MVHPPLSLGIPIRQWPGVGLTSLRKQTCGVVSCRGGYRPASVSWASGSPWIVPTLLVGSRVSFWEPEEGVAGRCSLAGSMMTCCFGPDPRSCGVRADMSLRKAKPSLIPPSCAVSADLASVVSLVPSESGCVRRKQVLAMAVCLCRGPSLWLVQVYPWPM